ncbi:FtsX-like permease family protein [Nocardiopsis sp. NPDC007018]|uniref:FtsX-like permease family protein n=1 Tax=Nocardiopsis sp. NPDC007018 TaxID=3155721 RepID=UPI0033CDBBE3
MLPSRDRLSPLLATLRLARRDLLRHRTASLLLALLLALLVGGAVAGDALVRSSSPSAESRATTLMGEAAQARVEWVVPGRVLQSPEGERAVSEGDGESAPSRGEYEVLLLSLLPEGSSLLGAVRATVDAESAGRSAEDLTVLETDTGGPELAGMFVSEEGVPPEEPGEASVGADLALRLGLSPGDSLVLTDAGGDEHTVTVTGVHRAARDRTDLLLAPGGLPDQGDRLDAPVSSPVWFVSGHAPVTWETVLEINATGSSVLSRAVIADPPDPEEVALPADPAASVPPSPWVFGSALAGVCLLTGLVVGPAVAVRARRATRDLALMAAQGGDPRTLRRIVLAQAFLVSSAGGLVGAAAGWGGVWAFTSLARARGDVTFPELVLPVRDVALLWLLGVAVTLASALPPAVRAGRADPVAALSGRPVPPPRRTRVWWAAPFLLSGAALTAAALLVPASSLYVPGAAVASLGLVPLAPALAVSAARPAGRLPLVARLALREAGRHRERTGMAVTVVATAVAALVAVAVTGASVVAAEVEAHPPRAAVGTALLSFDASEEPAPERVDAAADTLRAELGAEEVVPVRMLAPDRRWRPLPDPNRPCPEWAVTPPPGTRTEPVPEGLLQGEPNCALDGFGLALGTSWPTGGWDNALVDDGSLVRALDLPGARRAADALADGRVVVTRDAGLWTDGGARVEIAPPGEGTWTFGESRGEDGGSVVGDTGDPGDDGGDVPGGTTGNPGPDAGLGIDAEGVPAVEDSEEPTGPAPDADVLVRDAVAVEWPGTGYGLIVPPSLAAERGQEVRTVGLVAPAVGRPSPEAVEGARSAVREAAAADLSVEEPYASPRARRTHALLALAALVAVGACLVATRLAAEDARSERRTLLVVGASPRTDRQLGAARSGVLAVLGVLAGSVAGLAVGTAVVVGENLAPGFHDPVWPLVVPWPLLSGVLGGLVAAAVALGAATAPVTKRVRVRGRNPSA